MRFSNIATFIIITCYSCSSPHDVPTRIKKEFYCYNGKPTGIDSLININGYFAKVGSSDLFFFSDGIFIMTSANTNSYYCDYMKSIASQEKLPFAGIYTIGNKIIKAQFLSPGAAGTYYAFENWYQIIDRNTIKLIYAKNIGLESKYEQRQEKTYKDEKPFVFVPACDTLPVSNTWLKKQSWSWCK